MSDAPIEFDGIVKRFGRRTVLDDLSFSVPEGSVVGLLGPNGSGKSTAMRVLLGLQRASAGRARVLGREPGSPAFRDAARRVGAIIESPPPYRNATARENLEVRRAAMGPAARDTDLGELLHRVGLRGREDDRTGSFSLGMRQRVGIALALVGDPAVVILDEPTNGLDPEGTVEIRDVVRSLPARGATTLLCTHRLEEVEATCDYVVVLQQGRLIARGSLEEIIGMGSAGGVAIRVASGDVEAALRVVAGLGLGEATLDDGEIVTATTPADTAAVTHALADEGIYLQGLRVRRATLEQAFLKLTHAAEAG